MTTFRKDLAGQVASFGAAVLGITLWYSLPGLFSEEPEGPVYANAAEKDFRERATDATSKRARDQWTQAAEVAATLEVDSRSEREKAQDIADQLEVYQAAFCGEHPHKC